MYGNYLFGHEPFYIGKGLGYRKSEHMKPSRLKTDCNKLKTNKIKKILEDTGEQPIVSVYKNGLSENESFDLEIDMIRCIGRKDKNSGPLTNLTDGGEGSSGIFGRTLSEEHKRKISISSKNSWNNLNRKRSIYTLTEEQKKLNSLKTIGNKNGMNKYTYSLYKERELIYTGYSIREMADNFGLRYKTLVKISSNGNTHLKKYTLNREIKNGKI